MQSQKRSETKTRGFPDGTIVSVEVYDERGSKLMEKKVKIDKGREVEI